jgi:uncharacterized protein
MNDAGSADIVVIKKEVGVGETWRYSGIVLERRENSVLLEARFNREDMVHYGMPLGRGDRFVEVYFSDRWYNIYEVHDRADDHLKGWYCNVSCPAEFSDGQVSYIDLALDLLVFPDGTQKVLDEDEFAGLKIDDATRSRAKETLSTLQEMFRSPKDFRIEKI